VPLLKATQLVKFYGSRKVVDGVSYDVNPGEVVGLLGPNGAGKTTSFRMTTGQINPNGGQVFFNGEEITHHPMFRRARLGMGYLSQEPSIFRKLTVEQNLMAILEALPKSRTLGRRLTKSERWERTEEALARFHLTNVRNNNAARCSGGEKRRLEIARCLVCEPLLILLDEPLAAVDPLTKEDIRHNIRDLANQGIGILLTDHDVREVLKIADRAYLIIGGKVVAHGTPDELKRNKIAIDGYLGDTFEDEGYTRANQSGNGTVQRPKPYEPPAALKPRSFKVDIPEPETIIPLSSAESIPFPSIAVADRGNQPPPPPPRSNFLGSTQQLLEYEKMRRWVEQLQDRDRMTTAWSELKSRGDAAVPVLIEALERRELDLRHLALRLLETITGEKLNFQSDAAEDVRLRQIAQLRAKFGNR
jgi:lipopolysaccharide export system ATP-binding protein